MTTVRRFGRIRRMARWLWVLALLLPLPLPGFGEDVVVIVNRDNTNRIDLAFVSRVYTGTVKGWPDGTPVFLLDQPEDSPTRELFYTTVLRKSVAHMRAIWSQNIFTGKGLPPKAVTADSDMKRIIASNRNAIGYIRASQLDDTVRAIEP